MRAAVALAIIVTANSALVAQAQSLQEQAACAEQAETAFQDYVSDAAPQSKILTRGYQSHYNQKLNKCLILINETFQSDGHAGSSTALLEAFEGHTFASYVFSGKTRADCQLSPLNKITFCLSRDEFDQFVSKYMEQ